MRDTRHPWTPEELAWLREHRPHTHIKDLLPRFNALFPPRSLHALRTGCHRHGIHAAFSTHFGSPGPDGAPFIPNADPRARKPWAAANLPPNTRELGAWRRNGDYWTIKLYEGRGTRPAGGGRTNWVPAHRHFWEEANGPVPPGHHIYFIDGDHDNLDLDNLVCLSTSVRAHWGNLLQREHPDAPAATRRALLALAQLRATLYQTARTRLGLHRPGDLKQLLTAAEPAP